MADLLEQQQQHQQPQEDLGTVNTRGTRARNSRRPVSHFCACCSCLMLTSERLPIRLEPCGHVTCSRCADQDTVISCPTCHASAVRGLPDQSLQIEVVNYFSQSFETNLATSAMKSDSIAISKTNWTALHLQLEEHKSRSKRQTNQSKVKLARNRSDSTQWRSQLEMIGTRMRNLEATLEQLNVELGDLTKELANEMARERQLKQLETDSREKLDRLQDNLRSLIEQKASSLEVQAGVQSQIEAKKRVIQGVSAAQHSMSMELSKLQALCGGGSGEQL